MSSDPTENHASFATMFSQEEQNQLRSFLDNLEQPDNNDTMNQYIPESSSNRQRRNNNKKTPYDRTTKIRSPSIDEESSSTPTPKSKGGRARKPIHELLSEDQKKANHIASEQKRRANIRIGFDHLVDIVPSLDSCHRSESFILHKSVDYIRDLVKNKNELKERARELQAILGEVPDEDSSEGEMEYY